MGQNREFRKRLTHPIYDKDVTVINQGKNALVPK